MLAEILSQKTSDTVDNHCVETNSRKRMVARMQLTSSHAVITALADLQRRQPSLLSGNTSTYNRLRDLKTFSESYKRLENLDRLLPGTHNISTREQPVPTGKDAEG